MTKFLLTIIGDFKQEDILSEIALTLTPIVDSPHLKFQSSHGALIFHFASEVAQEEIHDYVQGSLFGLIDCFILVEYTDKVSVCMTKELKDHLFDLENESDGVMNISLDMSHIKNNSDFMEDEEDDDFVALLLNQVKEKVKKPSLDYILDKIANKGMDSLSQFEKDTLDLYSKI
jgi:hypothetical protein